MSVTLFPTSRPSGYKDTTPVASSLPSLPPSHPSPPPGTCQGLDPRAFKEWGSRGGGGWLLPLPAPIWALPAGCRVVIVRGWRPLHVIHFPWYLRHRGSWGLGMRRGRLGLETGPEFRGPTSNSTWLWVLFPFNFNFSVFRRDMIIMTIMFTLTTS